MQQARCKKCGVRWIWSRDVSMEHLIAQDWKPYPVCPDPRCRGEMVQTTHLYTGPTKAHPAATLHASGKLPDWWNVT